MLPQYPTAEDLQKGFTKGEPLTVLGSEQRGHEFLHLQYLLQKTLLWVLQKGESLTALGSQQRGHEFLHLQYPTMEAFYKTFYKGRTFDSSGFSTEGTLISASAVSHH